MLRAVDVGTCKAECRLPTADQPRKARILCFDHDGAGAKKKQIEGMLPRNHMPGHSRGGRLCTPSTAPVHGILTIFFPQLARLPFPPFSAFTTVHYGMTRQTEKLGLLGLAWDRRGVTTELRGHNSQVAMPPH
jgi:hypothetical protein